MVVAMDVEIDPGGDLSVNTLTGERIDATVSPD